MGRCRPRNLAKNAGGYRRPITFFMAIAAIPPNTARAIRGAGIRQD